MACSMHTRWSFLLQRSIQYKIHLDVNFRHAVGRSYNQKDADFYSLALYLDKLFLSARKAYMEMTDE